MGGLGAGGGGASVVSDADTREVIEVIFHRFVQERPRTLQKIFALCPSRRSDVIISSASAGHKNCTHAPYV